jgi:hypothetical protein
MPTPMPRLLTIGITTTYRAFFMDPNHFSANIPLMICSMFNE